MRYGEDVIEEVRSRNDILDVISGYVKLKKQGSNYFGLCPFHNEKSPSFSVTPSKQMFYCFGCQKGGNVFTFIEEYENCEFPEALQMLAERSGIALPERSMGEEEKREQSLKARLLEVNKEAAKYYYAQLRSQGGGAGMNYFTGRQLSEETMRSFGLGFASQGGGLWRYLKSKGYNDELLSQSGLVTIDEKRGMSDKFWNRVMFPIMDEKNRVIAFGGRVMGDAKPKYLNSPETRIFDKSRTLYGLNRARSTKTGYLIMCEGYMDVISLHQAGFTQAVATLGTAVTPGHANLISRFVKNVLLIYDSDDAGVNAAKKAIPILKGAGVTSKVVNLKPYKDPDEFIKNLGAEEFEKRLKNAENSFYFEMRVLERDFDMSDPDGRTRFIGAMAGHIAAMENAVERESYIAALASRYSVTPQILQDAVVKAAADRDRIQRYERPRTGRSEHKEEREDGLHKVQRLLLTSLVENPEIFPQVEKYVKPEDFDEGVIRRVAEALYEQLRENKLNPAAIVSLFDDEEDHSTVAMLFHSQYGDIEAKSDRERYITDLVVRIRKNAIMKTQSNGGADAGGKDLLKNELAKRKMVDELKKIHIKL